MQHMYECMQCLNFDHIHANEIRASPWKRQINLLMQHMQYVQTYRDSLGFFAEGLAGMSTVRRPVVLP